MREAGSQSDRQSHASGISFAVPPSGRSGMLRLATAFFAVGIAARSVPSDAMSPAPLIAWMSFSLFLILLVLGLPWTRRLLE